MSQNAVLPLAEAISENLYQALAYYEIFVPSGFDPQLISRVNKKISPGFNVVSEALQLGVITMLCRIWDKRSGTARISEAATLLRRNPALIRDQSLFAPWEADLAVVEQSEPLKVLRGYRNVGLAHTADPNAPDSRALSNTRRVREGDERVVLEATIPLVDKLNTMIGYQSQYGSFGQLRMAWQRHAVAFWATVAP